MTSTILGNGLIEIPESFRQADDLRPGQHFEIERVSHREYLVRFDLTEKHPKESLVDVLLDCPAKGFFVPMNQSDTTEDLKPDVFN
jgi:hypothetical protein